MVADPDDVFFEQLYTSAGDDLEQVPWAKLVPRPSLVEWLDSLDGTGPRRALVVGCGLGDDAEEVARRGHSVVAFDVSSTAIAHCHKRFPDSSVRYVVADLLAAPVEWHRAFDVVVEINTIQSLPFPKHRPVIAAIADCLAPGGEIFLRCSARDNDEPTHERPWPLSRRELSAFIREGLIEVDFRDDIAESGGRVFEIVYERPVPDA